MVATAPSALATVELSDTTFVFYVNSNRNIGYLKGPAGSAKILQRTTYGEPQQVKVGTGPVQVVKGFKHVGAIAYNNKQIRVYYVGENPNDNDGNILREIWSDDLGATWEYGVLGQPGVGILNSVFQGSGINAVVLQNTNELRVYFTKAEEQSLAVAWMPITGDLHAGDWIVAPNLRSIKQPW